MSANSAAGKIMSFVGYITMLFLCSIAGAELWEALLSSSIFGLFMFLLIKEERQNYINEHILSPISEKEKVESEISLLEDKQSDLKLELAWTEDDNRTTARIAKEKYETALASDNIPLLNSFYRETNTALEQARGPGWPVNVGGTVYSSELQTRQKRRAVMDRLAELC